MRHHTNCSNWGYDTHPDRATLAERCRRLSQAIVRRTSLFARFKFDTRPGHRFLFVGLTPDECHCIAGTYRGTRSCVPLADCRVTVGNDSSVGLEPILVDAAMLALERQCEALLAVHQRWWEQRGSQQNPRNALLRFAVVLATVLEKFLTIHPYMDGNGHCARLLVYTMMVRAGYVPGGLDIDAQQPYGDALSAHRRGKPGALQAYILGVIAGATA